MLAPESQDELVVREVAARLLVKPIQTGLLSNIRDVGFRQGMNADVERLPIQFIVVVLDVG